MNLPAFSQWARVYGLTAAWNVSPTVIFSLSLTCFCMKHDMKDEFILREERKTCRFFIWFWFFFFLWNLCKCILQWSASIPGETCVQTTLYRHDYIHFKMLHRLHVSKNKTTLNLCGCFSRTVCDRNKKPYF